MEPLIRDGDWVEVLRSAAAWRGSVVLARSSAGELVCHRLLERTGRGLRLAGDRSSSAQEHARGSLLGVVRRVERDGRVTRLDGGWTRHLDRLQARLHLLSIEHRRSVAGVVLEALRRGLLALRGATRSASISGTSSRRRPASSR